MYVSLSGRSYIELPKWISNKKAIMNVENKDNKCFLYAILSAIYSVDENHHTVTKYNDYMSKFNEIFKKFKIEFIDAPKYFYKCIL